MGAGEMPAFLPVLDSVSLTISSRILLKSWNFWPGICRNSPHSSAFDSLSEVVTSSLGPFASDLGALLMSWRTSGRRVTIPVPRGRLHYLVSMTTASLRKQMGAGVTDKSRPTMFSRTELFPLD